MLHLAVQHVTDALSTYVDLQTGVSRAVEHSSLVKPENQAEEAIRNKLVVTVVRLEEDRLARVTEHYERTADDQVRRVEPPTRMTAYLLIAATHAAYGEALKAIGYAITCFQAMRSIDYADIEGVEDTGRLVLEMDSPSFEQLNQLWGLVGAKYMPSVLYRMRYVSVRDARPEAPQPPTRALAIATS